MNEQEQDRKRREANGRRIRRLCEELKLAIMPGIEAYVEGHINLITLIKEVVNISDLNFYKVYKKTTRKENENE